MTQPELPLQVLVVDDDDDTRELLGLLLRRQHGWRSVFAADLKEAGAALAATDISALITDLNLPDGSGLSLLANRRPSLRAAVVMTGTASEEQRRRCTQSGFDAYVVKPFDGRAVVRLLEKLLGAKATGVTGPAMLVPKLLAFPDEERR